MQVIPVIDIRGGVVVAARGGARETYAPIVTPLAAGSGIVDVVRGLLGLYPFQTLYIADLDGIAGSGSDMASLTALRRTFPGLRLMVDDGSATVDRAGTLAGLGVLPVVGSETLPSAARLQEIMSALGGGVALSLDFFGSKFRGPEGLVDAPALWPPTIIAMTLAAVGMDRGPDLASVQRLKGLAGPGRRVLAAGGVRDKSDLAALKSAGATGVLVASALHAQKIRADDLVEVTGPDR